MTLEQSVVIASAILGLLRVLPWFQEQRLSRRNLLIMRIIEAGVMEAYTLIVRPAKALEPKLSLDARALAMETAINTANQLASERGIDLAKEMSSVELRSAIERIISERKSL